MLEEETAGAFKLVDRELKIYAHTIYSNKRKSCDNALRIGNTVVFLFLGVEFFQLGKQVFGGFALFYQRVHRSLMRQHSSS